MARLVVSVLLALAVLVTPALCAGGLLEHPCDGCDGAPTCDHEDDCSEDPCASLARAPEDDADFVFEFELPWVPAACPLLDGQHGADPPRAREVGSPPPPRVNLPYAESDRPLRT